MWTLFNTLTVICYNKYKFIKVVYFMPRKTHGETYGTELESNLEVINKELARLGGKGAEVQLLEKLTKTGDYGTGPFVLVDVIVPKFPKATVPNSVDPTTSLDVRVSKYPRSTGQKILDGIAVFKNNSDQQFQLSSSYLSPIQK
jgi:hypothetical protein